ncbi:MAG: hypothetical protein GXX85_15360 [Ignavibacteria bacterium]|nr:hypothetical protein [Ignavibacteria bacterium]
MRGFRSFSFFLVFVLIIFATTSSQAQTSNLKSPFISLHSGIFITSLENFSKTYDSKTGLVIGLGLGLPFSTRTYLYGKATYFSKTGVPVIGTYDLVDGQWILTSEKREGKAEYKQWLFNGGLLVKIFIDPEWTLGINGGITYSTVKEEQKNNDGTVGISVSDLSAFGLFIGAQVEKNFGNSPFSVFFEPQYNYMATGFPFINSQFGGFNFNAGIRFYFKERKLE